MSRVLIITPDKVKQKNWLRGFLLLHRVTYLGHHTKALFITLTLINALFMKNMVACLHMPFIRLANWMDVAGGGNFANKYSPYSPIKLKYREKRHKKFFSLSRFKVKIKR